MKLPNLARAAGLGTAMVLLTAGIASAAVATASVNVRSGPSTGYRIVDTLRPGEQVAIVDRSGSWCAVQKSGPDGWVSCNYLSSGLRSRTITVAPSVRLSFGFGMQPDRHHRDRYWRDHNRWDNNDWWDRNDRDGGSFGLSLSN